MFTTNFYETDVTCDVIRKVPPFVLSKLLILIADWRLVIVLVTWHISYKITTLHRTSLLSTPLPFWTSIITLGKKIDDEKTLLLKKIWLRRFLISRKQRNTWKKTCKWKIISRDKKTYLQIMIDKFSLTPNKWDIQPSVTWSSRNMDEIFDLKFHLLFIYLSQNFYQVPFMPEEGHFSDEF